MTRTRPDSYCVNLVKALCRPGGEAEWVEYKGNNANPEEIGQYISAIANAAALNDQTFGYLLWGVEDRTGKLVGTNFDPSIAKKGNEPLENWLLQLLNPRTHFKFHVVDVDGKRIVIAKIGRATNVPVRFNGVDYVRVGAVKKPLKEVPERERALWRTFDKTPFENRILCEGLSIDQVLRLLDYPVYFDLLNLPLPPTPDRIAAVLSGDKLIRRNIGSGWDILNLGGILLARSLEDFPTLERKAVRVIQYSEEGRIDTIREQTGKRGYAAGFEGVVDYINTLLPSNEVVGKALRETVLLFPEIAIRELVANMLIHQDFSITGTGPMVEIFSDRIEISNPGESLIATDRFIDAPPRSRNETMASLMRRFGICEERGSGIDKVIYAIEVSQLPAPLFETPPGATRSVIFAYKDLRDMNRADRVRAVYLHACLRYVTRAKTTNATLRQRFGIASRNAAIASRLLNEALEADMIVIEDPTAGRRNRSYLPFWAAPSTDEALEII